jgi:hypothetical protein
MDSNRKQHVPHLMMGLDFGSSSTKGCYKLEQGRTSSLLLMEPEVVTIVRPTVENYMLTRIGETLPENSAWVEVDDEFRAVGFLAQRFHGEAGLKELKYERAVYKTLAAVWVVSQKLGIKEEKIKLSLCCVLPPSEYSDRLRFESKLKVSLREFTVPTGVFNVELVNFLIRPEGAGIHMAYQYENRDLVLNSTVSILMLGYRNASLLSARRGEILPNYSSDYGFARFIEGVSQRVSGLNFRLATSAIALAGFPPDTNKLSPLLRSRTEKGRQEDLAILLEAIKIAREDYLEVLLIWLADQQPEDIDLMILAGGTAKYFQSELIERIKDCQVVFGTKNLHGSTIKKNYDERFEDISELFRYFLVKVKQNEKK